MNLAAGQTLLHYRLVAPIGQGGMGVVWRAHDTTLGRDVALKFLPEMLTGDPERMARLEREARLLASLHHPHVASIFGFHLHDGARFLAMELVEGDDLAQRLAHGPIPVADALPLALQIAEALEHAHEKGVIHRDLKPANVKLDAAGAAKVLDFGLAKAIEGDPANPRSGSALSHSPTITGGMTAANVLLGTAAYMSPEQARGQVADRRADIWAFGVVLMEMLTGRRLFEGETISDTLAAVLRADPDFDSLPKDTPPSIRRLLRRCLERDPKKRLRDIGEARILLDEVIRGVPDEAAPVAAVAPARGFAWMPLVAGLVLGGLVAFVVARSSAPRTEVPLRKFAFDPDTSGASAQSPVISPDGRSIACLVGGRLVVRDLSHLESRSYPVERGAICLNWSPDSRNLVYVSGSRLFRCSATDGSQTMLTDTGAEFTGGSGTSWTSRGTIVFSRGDTVGILEVSERGGDARPLIPVVSAEEGDLHEPHALPGDRGILFPVHTNRDGVSQLAVWSKGRRKVLLSLPGQRIEHPCYDPAGFVVFRRSPNTPGLWAVPFSLAALKTTGEPFLVSADGAYPSVSADGTLCYQPGGGGSTSRLAWLSEAGRRSDVFGQLGERSGFTLTKDPTGPRVIRSEEDAGNSDLWLYDHARGTRTRLTSAPDEEDVPAISPDGRRLAYMTRPAGCGAADCFKVVVSSMDRTGPVDTLASAAVLPFWSADGRDVHFVKLSQDFSTWSLYRRPADRSGPEVLTVPGNPRAVMGTVSPDGRWIAYVSYESERYDVFVAPYPGLEGRWQVSTQGGQWPQWSPKGDRIYFVRSDEIFAVDMTPGPEPTLGIPVAVATRPRTPLAAFGFEWQFLMGDDGQRILTMVPPTDASQMPSLVVAQNWSREFRGKR